MRQTFIALPETANNEPSEEKAIVVGCNKKGI
jgi:hypothetical protein